jgi:hypothetical protein
MTKLLAFFALLLATAAVAAPIEVTVDDLNKARDAYSQSQQDKLIASLNPETMNISLNVGGKEYSFPIKSSDAGFAAVLSAVKSAAAARLAAPSSLQVIIKEPTK